MPVRSCERREKSTRTAGGGASSTTSAASLQPRHSTAIKNSERRRMTALQSFGRGRSIPVNDLAVISDCQPVKHVQIDRRAQGCDMAVDEQELANAGVIAAELAMKGAGQIIGPQS